MGRYMTVVLKKQYIYDEWIDVLNKELADNFGANTCIKFNTWKYLQEQCEYINEHPHGKKQLPHWQRPITTQTLNENFFWYRVGNFSFKLSGDNTTDDARDAVAICKWLIKTKNRYIDKSKSENYSLKIVQQYLNYLLMEDGYDLELLWNID
jgi:3-methyladenine DNA glycosylase AlkD